MSLFFLCFSLPHTSTNWCERLAIMKGGDRVDALITGKSESTHLFLGVGKRGKDYFYNSVF